MRYELTVAVRQLRSSRSQTGLLLAGVAVGVLVFTFIAALINGLRVIITDDVVGNIADVTLEPPDRVPRLLPGVADPGATTLVAVQPSLERRAQIRAWRSFLPTIEGTPGVERVSPQVVGSGFLARGQTIKPATITGVEPDKLDAILDLSSKLVEGAPRLDVDDILIGSELAEDLGVGIGSRVVLNSERGRSKTLVVRGIFTLGNPQMDEALVYLNLRTAAGLLDLRNAVTRFEIEVHDLWQAPAVAARLEAATGLEAEDWIDQFPRLRDALQSQDSVGKLVKAFSLVSITIGIASALLLAVMRRRSEIGIMRSFGVTRASVVVIFVLQGLTIGFAGGLVGAGLGRLFTEVLAYGPRRADGRPVFPVAPEQGEYLIAILLATTAGAVAAVLPARAASKVDPVEVIGP